MKKWVKASIIAALALIVLVGVGALAGGLWVKRKIKTTLANETFAIAGTDYSVSAGRTSVNLLGRSVSLSDVKLVPAGNSSEIQPLKVKAERITVSGVSYKKGRRGEKPVAGAQRLLLVSPDVTIENLPANKPDKEHKKSLEETVSEKLREFSIGRIIIENGKLNISTHKNSDPKAYNIAGLQLSADNFRLGGMPEEGRVLFSDDVEASADRFSYRYKHGAMLIDITGIKAYSGNRTLSVAEFKMLPQYPKLEYAHKVADHADWTQVELTDLYATGVDYSRLVSGNAVQAEKITVAGVQLQSYKDRNLPPVKKKPMLYESLHNISMELSIPDVDIETMDIRYEELAPGGQMPGEVLLTGMQSKVSGLGNRAKTTTQMFTIVAKGKFMGVAEVESTMTMPVSRNYDHWETSGKLGEMDMKELNRLIAPLMGVSIESGKSHSLDFHISGNSVKTHTTATMIYDGLEIEILKKNDLEHERPLVTWLANELVVRDSNPDNRGRLHTGEGDADRDPYRSQFNFIVKSVFSALKKIFI